jgi:hypothetical protein
MRATVNHTVGFDTVTDHATATVGTGGRQRKDCVLEAVKGMRRTRPNDLETLIVVVTADFTHCHGRSFLLTVPCLDEP